MPGTPRRRPEVVNGADYLTANKLIPKGQLIVLEWMDKDYSIVTL